MKVRGSIFGVFFVGVGAGEITILQISKNEQWNNPCCCLGYIGDYTTQLYMEIIINHYKDPLLNNQYIGK